MRVSPNIVDSISVIFNSFVIDKTLPSVLEEVFQLDKKNKTNFIAFVYYGRMYWTMILKNSSLEITLSALAQDRPADSLQGFYLLGIVTTALLKFVPPASKTIIGSP